MVRLAAVVACSVALAVSAAPAAVPADSPERARLTTSFDEGWLFHKGNAEGAQEPGFNDSAWEKVNVPHDWSIAGHHGEVMALARSTADSGPITVTATARDLAPATITLEAAPASQSR